MKGQRKMRLRQLESRENCFGVAKVILIVAGVSAFAWCIVTTPMPVSPARMVAAQRARTCTRSVGKVSEAGKEPKTRVVYPPYLTVSFSELSSYPFTVTDMMTNSNPASAAVLDQIPERIRGMSRQKVAVTGFMLPVQLKGNLATEFLILANRSACCYGIAPDINQWIIARAKNGGVQPLMDVPVTALGTFHVGEQRENGELAGIYELDCDKIIAGDQF